MLNDIYVKGANINDDSTGSTSKLCANLPVILSLDEIIDLIEDQGVDCSPRSHSLYLLKRISYHRLKPYISALKRYSSLSEYHLKQVHDLLTFDRRLSAVTLKYIGIFETQMKARYIQLMGEKHGVFAWYEKDLFWREQIHKDTIKKMTDEIYRQASKGDKNLQEKLLIYDNKLPIWEVAEYISFGTISKLYSNTKDNEVTNEVAHFFNSNKDRLSSWLKTINNTRNICAHFNPYIIRKQIPGIPKADKKIGNNNTSTFFIFKMLESLLASSFTDALYDMNLNYSQRIQDDTYELISKFAFTYPQMSNWLRDSYENLW